MPSPFLHSRRQSLLFISIAIGFFALGRRASRWRAIDAAAPGNVPNPVPDRSLIAAAVSTITVMSLSNVDNGSDRFCTLPKAERGEQ